MIGSDRTDEVLSATSTPFPTCRMARAGSAPYVRGADAALSAQGREPVPRTASVSIGMNVRYTAIAALGLTRLDAATRRDVLAGRDVADLLQGILGLALAGAGSRRRRARRLGLRRDRADRPCGRRGAVYSVHQYAKAPMALLELHEAGGPNRREAVAQG
jgi:hypothetical protein